MSQFLRLELHGLFESAHKSQVPDVFAWAKEQDGYFRRFKGGAIAPWIHPEKPEAKRDLDLEARATLTFFEVSSNPVDIIVWLLNEYVSIY